MTYKSPVPFDARWDKIGVCSVDTESTGVVPGRDRVVQVALVRFENEEVVGELSSLINPRMPIPADATAIHGITDEMVSDAPMLADWFARDDVKELLSGCQPAAYHAAYDREMLLGATTIDNQWPWVDVIVPARFVDRYERGKGRHKLTAVCERHGVKLVDAHSALADARAAGELLYKLMRHPKMVAEFENKLGHAVPTIGELLFWLRKQETEQWWRFQTFIASNPTEAIT